MAPAALADSSPYRAPSFVLTTLCAWNITQRQLGRGPDRMESYPLLSVRKPAPTVAGDCPAFADALGAPFYWKALRSLKGGPTICLKSQKPTGCEKHGIFLGPAGKIIRMTNSAHGLLLTKNPACSCNCPWRQVHGISFERFPRPWQTVGPVSGPFHVADSSLAFFKEVGSSSRVTPSLVR